MRTATSGRRWMGAAAAIAACAIGVAACGGDDGGASSEGGSKPAADAPKGTPVKIMTFAAIDSPIQDYPDVFAAAKAAGLAINAEGGINGHPVEIVTCNDKADPNGAEACAREAVNDKVVSTVGWTIGGAKIYPILEAAGIQAISQSATPPDTSAANAWPLTGGADFSFAGAGPTLGQQGVKKLVHVATDLAASLDNVTAIEAGAKPAGVQVLPKTIKVPIETTDFAPIVQQIKNSGADGYIMSMAAQQIVQLLKAAEQLGLEAKPITWAGSLGPQSIKELGPTADGVAAVGQLPPPGSSDDLTKRFASEMKTAADQGVKDTEDARLAAEETWLGVHAIAALAKTIDGEITSASFKQALESAKDIDVLGFMTWTPTAPGPKLAPKVSNGKVFPGAVKGGVLSSGGDPLDVLEAMNNAAV